VIHVGDKIQVEIREIDDRGKLSLVPVEVIEREAAGEDLSGGEPEGGERSDRGDRPRRDRDDRGGSRDGGRTRSRSRGGQRD
jgi:polyribonucleotide nucleotidyltransferase